MKITDKGGSHTPAPEGTHIARCFAVIDLGTQLTTFQGRPKKARKLLIGFELPEEMREVSKGQAEPQAEPWTVWNRFTASLHPKSQLRPLLESWRGRAFTPEELTGFNVKNLVGVPAMLSIVHSDDGQYANIKGLAKLPRNTKCPPAIIPPVYLSLEPEEFDNKAFSSLSDKLKETIAASPEYAAIVGGEPPEPPEAEPGEEADDIPF